MQTVQFLDASAHKVLDTCAHLGKHCSFRKVFIAICAAEITIFGSHQNQLQHVGAIMLLAEQALKLTVFVYAPPDQKPAISQIFDYILPRVLKAVSSQQIQNTFAVLRLEDCN